MSAPQLVTAAAGGGLEVDATARTITGLLVPFGVPGATSQGRLTYSAGSLRWSEPRRVKLLVEHDQNRSCGYATELTETPEGLRGTFYVPPGQLGDTALAEAASGVRDGLSVGVELDDVTLQKLRRSTGQPVAASGQLRETSTVSVPAFDAARIENVAAAAGALAVTSWDTSAQPNQEGHAMSTPDTTPAQPAPQPAPEPAPAAPQPTVAATAPATAGSVPQPVATAAATVPAPQVVLATAGAASLQVTTEPSTYTFDGRGPSLVRDAYMARMDQNPEAAQRLHRFNAELAAGNPSSVMALAAVATTATDGPDSFIGPTTFRPDLLRSVIDRSRPIINRLGTTPIHNAQPFSLPIEGEFDGVDDHVEGTAHVPEGTFTAGDATVTPKSCSGAYRLSRELVDQSNPALDKIVLRAMVRDYRRHSEGKVVAALTAAAGAGTAVTGYMGLRAALAAFVGDDDLGADELFASKTYLAQLLAEEETGTGRPMLQVAGNIGGATARAGYTGAVIDNTEVVRASSVPAGSAFAVQNDAVMVFESPVQTFRFDEVEGPGIVKLALWAYLAAAVIDADGVERFNLA